MERTWEEYQRLRDAGPQEVIVDDDQISYVTERREAVGWIRTGLEMLEGGQVKLTFVMK